MRKIIASLAVIVSLAAAPSPADAAQAESGAIQAASTRCYEDQPCWTWSTMGNLTRGVVTKAGNDIIVTPCQYRLLRRAGRIDMRATPKLRGDYFALRNGCRPTLYA